MSVCLSVSLSVFVSLSVRVVWCLRSHLNVENGTIYFFIVILILPIIVPVVDAVIIIVIIIIIIVIIDTWLVFSTSQPINKHIRPKHIMLHHSKTAHTQGSSEP